jgi:GNAT superfamily N-acetyltransferase
MPEAIFPVQEKQPIKVEIATAKDWEECRKMRLKEIGGEDSEMFGHITENVLKREKDVSKEEWENNLNSPDQIFILLKSSSNSVGFGHAISKGDGLWRLRWDFVERDFRGQSFQEKIIAARLKEILKRGGREAEAGFIAWNKKSLDNYKAFGFEISKVDMKDSKELSPESYGYTAKVDLLNPAVIKKVNGFVL